LIAVGEVDPELTLIHDITTAVLIPVMAVDVDHRGPDPHRHHEHAGHQILPGAVNHTDGDDCHRQQQGEQRWQEHAGMHEVTAHADDIEDVQERTEEDQG